MGVMFEHNRTAKSDSARVELVFRIEVDSKAFSKRFLPYHDSPKDDNNG